MDLPNIGEIVNHISQYRVEYSVLAGTSLMVAACAKSWCKLYRETKREKEMLPKIEEYIHKKIIDKYVSPKPHKMPNSNK